MQIKAIVGSRSGQLDLLLDSGQAITVDLKPLIERGGVFAPLQFADRVGSAEIRQQGLYLEWPWGLDIGADSLWERRIIEGDPSNSKDGQAKTPGRHVSA